MTLPLFVLLLAGLGALAVWSKTRAPRAYVYAKLAPMVLILAVFALGLSGAEAGRGFLLWILLGLLFGMAGDALTPFERTVKPGIIAFALGHVFYLLAALLEAPAPPLWLPIVAVAPGLAFAAFLVRSTEQKQYAPLIWIYGPLISAMAAWGLYLELTVAGEPGLFSAGVLLFVVSDGFWSWNRFVRKFDWSAAAILSTYYAAQACITLGALQLARRL